LADQDACMTKCDADATCFSAEWRFTPAPTETKTCRLWKKAGLHGTGIAATGGSINETFHKKSDTTAAIGDLFAFYDKKDGLATGNELWR